MDIESKENGITHLKGSFTVDGVEIAVSGKEYSTKDGEKIKLFVETDSYYKAMKTNGIPRETIETIEAVRGKLLEGAHAMMVKDIEDRPSLTKREIRFGNTGLEASIRPYSTEPTGGFEKGKAKETRPVYGRVTVSQDVTLPTSLVKGSDTMNAFADRVRKVVEPLRSDAQKNAA